ncbi:MAG: hypothetical protein R3F30_13355 [Planctomycetota bacterium]
METVTEEGPGFITETLTHRDKGQDDATLSEDQRATRVRVTKTSSRR